LARETPFQSTEYNSRTTNENKATKVPPTLPLHLITGSS
jgi:hypothetical protein